MARNAATILAYATLSPSVPAFARQPAWLVAAVAAVVPGLASWLIRGRAGLYRMLLLWAAGILSFFVFGPLWGEVLFPNSELSEAGLYPFILACLLLSAASVWMALTDRRRVLEGRTMTKEFSPEDADARHATATKIQGQTDAAEGTLPYSRRCP